MLSKRRNEGMLVTHSLARFTKGEKIPEGKVLKAHPRRNLIDTASNNENERLSHPRQPPSRRPESEPGYRPSAFYIAYVDGKRHDHVLVNKQRSQPHRNRCGPIA